MTDEKRPEKYNGYTLEEWQTIIGQMIQHADADRTSAADYVSKISAWMIGQLFVVNAGAITFVGMSGDKVALSCFVVGILLAMSCSFSAWYHAVKEFEYSDLIGDAKALIDKKFFPTPSSAIEKSRENAYKATIFFGVLSIVSFAVGAVRLLYYAS
jgi:hypothetical protein